MDNTKYVALSRQMGLWKQMDIVSNNMANMNTSGYKQDEAVFSSYIVKTQNAAGFGKVPVFFTQDYGVFKDFQEGIFQETGNQLDVAIQGEGFFAIETPRGELYTRKGQFALDYEGKIVTKEGDVLLSENNEPFFWLRGKRKSVSAKAAKFQLKTGLSDASKSLILPDNQKLEKVGGTMFANTAGNLMTSGTAGVRVMQRMVEKSNVEPIVEMSKMIKLQRSYEYVQQMIDEEHERVSNTISTYAQLA